MTDSQNTGSVVQYVFDWGGLHSCMRANTHSCYDSNAPCGWSIKNRRYPGMFVHFQKTHCDRGGGAKTREKPFAPIPEWCLNGVSICRALREATKKNKWSPCLTNTAPLPLESDMDYISCDTFPSPPITLFHSTLPSSLEPFRANYRFCNWKSHHWKI